MNLRHLQAFVGIVELGGFARAAARLNLSQPALSRQIHALESAWGVQLFDRSNRSVQLTSEGEYLLRRARHLLAEADSLDERALSLKAGETGILRVGATPHVIETLLAGFLIRYRRRRPGVEIQLVEDGGRDLHGRLEHHDVHLAITVAGSAHFHERPLYPMHLVAAVSLQHPLRHRPVLEITGLANEPLLLLHRNFGSRQWFETACELAKIRPRVLLESGVPHTLAALAATDYGIAILPSNARLPADIVRAIPLVHRAASVGRWAHAVWDPHRFLPPYVEHFIEELAAYCRRGYPGRDLVRRAPPLAPPKAPASPLNHR